MIPDLWPDAKLEAEMIRDAEIWLDNDLSCHVKALLARVRELEKELAYLKSNSSELRPKGGWQL